MSVVTQANPNLEIVRSVREGCECLKGDAGACVNWIFDRMEFITDEHPDWSYRKVWRAMKGNKDWAYAGFDENAWQKASSHVANVFDRTFQAQPKRRRFVRRPTGTRGGRREPRGAQRGLAYAR